MILTATWRPSRSCSASYTWAIAPLPRMRPSLYLSSRTVPAIASSESVSRAIDLGPDPSVPKLHSQHHCRRGAHLRPHCEELCVQHLVGAAADLGQALEGRGA